MARSCAGATRAKPALTRSTMIDLPAITLSSGGKLEPLILDRLRGGAHADIQGNALSQAAENEASRSVIALGFSV
jgi:hypothetical protein